MQVASPISSGKRRIRNHICHHCPARLFRGMQVSAMRQLADGRFDAQAAPVMTTAEAKEPAQACGRILPDVFCYRWATPLRQSSRMLMPRGRTPQLRGYPTDFYSLAIPFERANACGPCHQATGPSSSI